MKTIRVYSRIGWEWKRYQIILVGIIVGVSVAVFVPLWLKGENNFTDDQSA